MQFIEGVKNDFQGIYGGSGSSENGSSEYFEKWGWYATIDMLAGNDILKIDLVLDKPVREFHTFLEHKLDKDKLEANLRKGGNVKTF